MANQKSNMHDIPLKTMDLCLNKFNADIRPYEGFRKNNSPFFGNTLSPFYKKTEAAIGDRSYIYRDGTIYRIKDDGNLYIIGRNGEADTMIMNLSDGNFLEKTERVNSGHSGYPIILGFFDEYGDREDTMLCSSLEGSLVILTKSGTVFKELTMPSGYTYETNEAIGFLHHYKNGAYSFAVGNAIFSTPSNGNTLSMYQVDGAQSRLYTYSFSCYEASSSVLTCCAKQTSTDQSTIVNITIGASTVSFNLATSIVATIGSATKTISSASGKAHMFFNNKGNAILTSAEYYIDDGSNKRIFNYAQVSSASGSTLNVSINPETYLLIGDISKEKYEFLSSICDNNTALEFVGHNNGGYYNVIKGEWKWRTKELIETILIYVFLPWPLSSLVRHLRKVVGHVEEQYYTGDTYVKVEGGYNIKMMDGNNHTTYNGIPITVDKRYEGGLSTTIGNKFRILYENGEASAVSVTSDAGTIGTLLSGYAQLDSNFPVIVNSDSTIMYFKDDVYWNEIKLTKDHTKAEMKIANGRYLIINTDGYYNAFDMEELIPHHFASDYNNRAILTFDQPSAFLDNNSFNNYISNSNCENYYYASGQGANYVVLNEAFPSYAPGLRTGFIPKKAYNLRTMVQAGFTPNQQDIDVYYGKVENGIPKYKYSVDSQDYVNSLAYVNSKLVDSNYVQDQILIPSIFADFLEGFINQGIIIDSGHSYIQVFANNTKPVLAIKLKDELEGVSAAFIIQGQYFVIINNSIYTYDPDTSALSAIVNISNMKLIGYTPYMAIFWSATNKTFYTFTGDNTLSVLVQADEINDIYSTAYNPDTMSIYVVTDDSVYIFGSDQLLRIELEGYTKCYPVINGAAFTGTANTAYISYNEIDGYRPEPIELETEFYGLGNGIKSVNDCVYIRLFSDKMEKGEVKLSCQSLNETGRQSETKVFNITPDMWDKQTKTLFIRYQPKLQAATGFSVHITSPFNIATLQISESIETVQNSKYNI